MRAIDVVDGRCVVVEVPTPEPGPGEVRLAVEAAGVNRADLVQKAGRYPPPPGASPILGLEVAGTIDAVGEGVDPSRVGEPVCALLAGGGYAEAVVCPATHAIPRPPGTSAVEAAAIVEVWATAWLNLVGEGGLGERDDAKVLLHAGASGVGTAAIQIAKHLGHRTFVTVGSAEKVARCVAFGADGGAVRHDGPWVEAVRAWAPEGVDLILDPVGAAYLGPDLDVLARDGRIVLIGLMSGRASEIDLGKVLMKRARLQGSTLRARPDAFKTALLEAMVARLWPGFGDGTFTAVVDRTFALADAEAAHAHVASNATVGAVVLTV